MFVLLTEMVRKSSDVCGCTCHMQSQDERRNKAFHLQRPNFTAGEYSTPG